MIKCNVNHLYLLFFYCKEGVWVWGRKDNGTGKERRQQDGNKIGNSLGVKDRVGGGQQKNFLEEELKNIHLNVPPIIRK